MSAIEDKKDNSAPTKGYFYAEEFNWINRLLAYFLEQKGVEFDSNNNFQVAKAIALGGNPPNFYTNISAATDTTLTIIHSNGIGEITSYKPGQIVYTEQELKYYNSGRNIQIDNAPKTAMAMISVATYYGNDFKVADNCLVFSTDTPLFNVVPRIQGEKSWLNSCNASYISDPGNPSPVVGEGYCWPGNKSDFTDCKITIMELDSSAAQNKIGFVGQMNILWFGTSSTNPLPSGSNGWPTVLQDWTNRYKITIKNLNVIQNNLQVNFKAVIICTKSGTGRNDPGEFDAYIIETLS